MVAAVVGVDAIGFLKTIIHLPTLTLHARLHDNIGKPGTTLLSFPPTMTEESIAKQISSLQEHYESLILCASLDNDDDDLMIPKTGRSGVALQVHQQQITFTIQSLFQLVSKLRAMRAQHTPEE